MTTTSSIVSEPKVLASFSLDKYVGFFKFNDFSIAINYSKIQQIQFCPPRRQWWEEQKQIGLERSCYV